LAAGAGTPYDVPAVTTESSNAGALRRPLRLPLIAALALAFVSLALISGIAYIVVLAGATGTAERLLVDRAAMRRLPWSEAGSIRSPSISS
jgi:adenylate cyclase